VASSVALDGVAPMVALALSDYELESFVEASVDLGVAALMDEERLRMVDRGSFPA